jgi:hypothetical protein
MKMADPGAEVVSPLLPRSYLVLNFHTNTLDPTDISKDQQECHSLSCIQSELESTDSPIHVNCFLPKILQSSPHRGFRGNRILMPLIPQLDNFAVLPDMIIEQADLDMCLDIENYVGKTNACSAYD